MKTKSAPILTVTTGWAVGRKVQFVGLAQGERGLVAQDIGPSTTIITAKPGQGDALVRLDDTEYGCLYRHLDPMPCRVLILPAEAADLPPDVLDNPDALTPLSDLGLRFVPQDHQQAVAFIERLVRRHGTFAWWNFCPNHACVVVGVDLSKAGRRIVRPVPAGGPTCNC